MTDDFICGKEIDAYLDGELDLIGRIGVEDHLARHPELAAQVMGDLRARNALKLLTMPVAAPPAAIVALVEQVRTKPRSGWRRRLGLAAGVIGTAATIAVAASLLWPDVDPAPPAYVRAAAVSHRTAMIRAGMASQPENPQVDARELLASAEIPMPLLPTDWRVTDVQLFPSEQRPALQVAVKTPEGRDMSIFVVRERTDAPAAPDTIREGEQSVAYWRDGEMSYALTGTGEPAPVGAAAQALNDMLKVTEMKT